LPLGTTVTLVTGRTKKSAVLERFGANPDGDFVVLRETASRTHQLPARAALRIEASRHQRIGVPKVVQTRAIRYDAGLAEGLNGSASDYVLQSSLGCVIVGSEARIRTDLETPLGVETQDGLVSHGQLQDLARVRRFGRDGEGF